MALNRGSNRNGRNNRRGKASGRSTPIIVAGVAGVLLFVGLIVVGLHLLRAPSDASVRATPVPVKVLTAEILVPLETVPVGVALQPNLFRKESRLEEQITGDIIRGFDELKGMYSRGVLFKGQPIPKAALTNRQPVHVLTALLPRDYRAVAIEVERPLLDNVDGWAQPGTDVDVVWITSVFGREMASILAGPVRILASNKATEWSPAKTPNGQADKVVTVTLLLSVRDAVRISLAAMHGKLSLGLRGMNDRRPNDASHPLSSVIEERVSKEERQGIVSVKVVDPESRGTEVRKYDSLGRRLSE
jgi:Flp pilus assembly protein CpaB